MGDPKYALTGKTLRGKILFTAATSGELLLKQGGPWKADEYSVQPTLLLRTLDSIDVTAVDETLYQVTVDGKVYGFTSGVGTTTQLIRDGLIAAIQALTPSNGVTAQLVDANTFTVRGIKAGDPVTVSVGTNLTLTRAFDTAPTWAVFKEDGKVIVRTTAAFTGAFDVLVQG